MVRPPILEFAGSNPVGAKLYRNFHNPHPCSNTGGLWNPGISHRA